MQMLRQGMLGIGLTILLSACPADNGTGTPKTAVQAERHADGTIKDDRSLCLPQAPRKGIEISETAGPGALQPNVRRLWKVVGVGSARRKTLICREVDTNLDGIKDVVRLYNDDGQSKQERADTNYDGKIDTWNIFVKGRLAEVELDHNHDGQADEWKVYSEGRLSRVKRDSNFDGRADIWEMYRKGRLERMGVDLDGDERVDRWDYDREWRKKLETAARRRREKDDRKKKEDAERRRKEAEEAASDTEE